MTKPKQREKALSVEKRRQFEAEKDELRAKAAQLKQEFLIRDAERKSR